MQKQGDLSRQALKRLPEYYNYLRALQAGHVEYVAAPAIARAMGLNEVQVRKDLAAVNQNPGKPRKGFKVAELLDGIRGQLGYHNSTDAVLVGAGRLGTALLCYEGFGERGIRIAAAFDASDQVIGTRRGGKEILALDKLEEVCKKKHVHLGIITVPAAQAQPVCDLMAQSGILAIWNFAPVHLRVPEGVLVQNENMAVQLATLSRHLAKQLERSRAG